MRGSSQLLSLLACVSLSSCGWSAAALESRGESATLLSYTNAQVKVTYIPNKIKMTMDNTTHIDYSITIDRTAFTLNSDKIVLQFRPVTLSPQLEILEFNNSINPNLETFKLDKQLLARDNYTYSSTIYLKSTYIGHATIELSAHLLMADGKNESLVVAGEVSSSPDITIVRNEGAQIDIDNVRRLIATPKIIILGFLIGATVMPMASWTAGHVFFHDQPMYRIGSFIYATAPAASASVLWTVMFDSDKELALGLQITSTVGALIMMPTLLYAMDKAIDLEGQYTIRVPYMNLARTLVVLLVALLIGRYVGRSKRARLISQRIFRPLTMFVLLFIIVFSSIVYWYIYRMFNLRITLMAFFVTCATYVLSGLLGYIINRDLDHMITISISSTYRNSGIAFAALVVAFQPPDIFIAYVPCLTQVVTTSLIGLVFYTLKIIKNRYSKPGDQLPDS